MVTPHSWLELGEEAGIVDSLLEVLFATPPRPRPTRPRAHRARLPRDRSFCGGVANPAAGRRSTLQIPVSPVAVGAQPKRHPSGHFFDDLSQGPSTSRITYRMTSTVVIEGLPPDAPALMQRLEDGHTFSSSSDAPSIASGRALRRTSSVV